MSDEGPETMVAWQIRLIPARVRDEVVRRAKQSDISVGALVERIVTDWLNEGAPVPVASAAPPAPSSSAPTAGELAALMQGVAALATAAKDNPAITEADVRAAATTLRRETKTRRGPSPRPSRPRQLAGPPGSTEGTSAAP